MAFMKWEDSQYRSASFDELNKRYNEIAEELVNAESELSFDELDSEAKRCKECMERIERSNQMMVEARNAVNSGAGNVVERSGLTFEKFNTVELRGNDDVHDTAEYRNAFMDLVCRGKETRTDAFTLTTDAPVAIPTTLSNMVIEKLDTYGQIYPLVDKSNFQGGYEIPIDDFGFTASWVTEEQVTDTQKAERKNKLTFSYHEFEARVGWSFLAGITTFDAFTAKFQPKMSEAIVKLLEKGIINGTGSGQMLGITKDPRITNVVEMTAAQFDAWQEWHSRIDAAIPMEYDNGGFIMPKTTWNKHIDTMRDSNNHPIGSWEFDPVARKREYQLMGKPTLITGGSEALLPDFDSAAAGSIVAIYGDLKNYCINWQPGGGISILRYADYDKRKNKLFGYGVCDGKVVDPYGFMLIKKKASA